MLTEEQLEIAIGHIFEDLKIVGPSVEKPSLKMTSFGAEVNAGNLRLIIYDVSRKDLGDKYQNSVAGAKDFGRDLAPGERYRSQGMFTSDEIDIGWYLVAKKEILP